MPKANLAQTNPQSNEKHNPGFAPIRRGLLEHWPEMSVNARAFYVWLHLNAKWKGPKRGWVEASFDDMARGNCWSVKTVQRTIEELEALPFIEVERASNQYELTRIKILRYDLEETDSAPVKSVHSSVAPVSAPDSAAVSGAVKSVHSNPSILQNQRDLQAPKKLRSKEEKKERLDAVRRPFDAEQRLAARKAFSPSEKRKKLEKRLEAKALKGGNIFEGAFDADEIAAFGATQYRIRDQKCLTGGFVYVVWEVYDDWKDEGLPPGILCSKIIDRCKAEQESCKKLGSDPSEYFWPPDFQDHRDRLRAQERVRERVSPTAEVCA